MKNRVVCALLLVQYLLLVQVRSKHVNTRRDAVSLTSDMLSDEQHRIIGGTAAKRGDFPWQVYITYYNHIIGKVQECGGSIIDPRWILTDARCTYTSSIFEITVGATDRSQMEHGVTRYITDLVHIHSEFNSKTFENDIALLELPTPISLEKSLAEKINLPGLSDADRKFEGVTAFVGGWGRMADGLNSDILQYVRVPVISNEECNNYYNQFLSGGKKIYGSMICTSARNGTTNICHGDSGGPLVYQNASSGAWTQIGIASFGNCEFPDEQSTVFTRVTSYLDWIAKITGIPC